MSSLMDMLVWLTFIVTLIQGLLNLPGAIADIVYLKRISNKHKRDE